MFLLFRRNCLLLYFSLIFIKHAIAINSNTQLNWYVFDIASLYFIFLIKQMDFSISLDYILFVSYSLMDARIYICSSNSRHLQRETIAIWMGVVFILFCMMVKIMQTIIKHRSIINWFLFMDFNETKVSKPATIAVFELGMILIRNSD